MFDENINIFQITFIKYSNNSQSWISLIYKFKQKCLSKINNWSF